MEEFKQDGHIFNTRRRELLREFGLLEMLDVGGVSMSVFNGDVEGILVFLFDGGVEDVSQCVYFLKMSHSVSVMEMVKVSQCFLMMGVPHSQVLEMVKVFQCVCDGDDEGFSVCL